MDGRTVPRAGEGPWPARAVVRTCAYDPLGVDQHAGIEDFGGIEGALGGAERPGKGLGPLAVVPRPVVTADCVVMGDRPPCVEHRLRDRRLDLIPLLDLAASHRGA